MESEKIKGLRNQRLREREAYLEEGKKLKAKSCTAGNIKGHAF